MMYFVILKNKEHKNVPGYFLNESFEVLKVFKNIYHKGNYISSIEKLLSKYNISDENKILCDTLEEGIQKIKDHIKFETMEKKGDIALLLSDEEIDSLINKRKKSDKAMKDALDDKFSTLTLEELLFIKHFGSSPVLRKFMSKEEIFTCNKLHKKGFMYKGKSDNSNASVFFQVESFVLSRI